jgi:hypothetical protein
VEIGVIKNLNFFCVNLTYIVITSTTLRDDSTLNLIKNDPVQYFLDFNDDDNGIMHHHYEVISPRQLGFSVFMIIITQKLRSILTKEKTITTSMVK